MALTANERFKRAGARWFWSSLILAAALHFAFFQFFPKLTAAALGERGDGTTELIRLPEFDIPPPPDLIQRPRPPVVARTEVDEEPTTPTTLKENPVRTLPPPPAEVGRGAEAGPFTPFTVRPELKDPRRALRIVEDHYPERLKSAGVGGRVTVTALVDTAGRVVDVWVKGGSGYPELDRAALEAVRLFEFTPALNRDVKVAVRIEQVISFKVK